MELTVSRHTGQTFTRWAQKLSQDFFDFFVFFMDYQLYLPFRNGPKTLNMFYSQSKCLTYLIVGN